MTRKIIIYTLIGVAMLFLVSRIVTLALMLAYSAEDAGRYFYLQNTGLALVAAVLIVWLWRKRTGPDAE